MTPPGSIRARPFHTLTLTARKSAAVSCQLLLTGSENRRLAESSAAFRDVRHSPHECADTFGLILPPLKKVVNVGGPPTYLN